MGLWAGKPSRYVTSHLGQLSLPFLWGRSIEYRPLAWVKAGCVHLCRLAGSTVWSHMASDTPWLWDGIPLTAIQDLWPLTFSLGVVWFSVKLVTLCRVQLVLSRVTIRKWRSLSRQSLVLVLVSGLKDEKLIKKSKPTQKLKHANSILKYFEYFCQMSSKSILIILTYTISKLVHFLRHSVVGTFCPPCTCSLSVINETQWRTNHLVHVKYAFQRYCRFCAPARQFFPTPPLVSENLPMFPWE